MAMACRPEEQKRFTVMAAVETGSPACSAETRAMLWPCTPWGWPQPRITSSISAGIELRRLAQDILDAMGGQVLGPRHVEGAAKRFGKAGARTGNYDGFSHVGRWSIVVGRWPNTIGWCKRLSGCNFLLVEVGEGAAFGGQFFQQRSGLPEFAVLRAEIRRCGRRLFSVRPCRRTTSGRRDRPGSRSR